MSTPASPSDPRTRQGSLSTGPFSFTDEGDRQGPVVLAVPGYPGGTRDYRWLAPALDPGLRLIRIDMPAFGQTPLSTCPATDIAGRAAYVAEILERLDLEKVVLVGHSMGGAIAGSAAALAPERVGGLALLASIGPRPHPTVAHGEPARFVRLVTGRLTGPVLRPLLPRFFELAGFPRRWDRPQLIHTLRCAADLDFPAWAATLRALELPTLVAWAEDDPLIPTAISEELAAAAPRGPRFGFSEGGHNIQKFQAVELGAAISALARDVASGPQPTADLPR